MIPRFSLYGFLKNQKYYEPFLILAFLDKGLSYFMIGVLIGFRQVWVNILEIPSGFLADTFGRRRSMILSFAAYIVSFVIFALSSAVWSLFPAMFFFAIGEAFRTGTHKAMIFDWLAHEGRGDERTRVYGYTRSWSQIGSAVSVVLAAAAVMITENYTAIFWLSLIPYMVNIVNFLGYPAYLDGKAPRDLTMRELRDRFIGTLGDSFRNRPLRRLFLESAVYRGNAAMARDYLQPLLGVAALSLPLLTRETPERRSALLVGVIFFVLYFASSLAARQAHRFAAQPARGGWTGEETASRRLWLMSFLVFLPAAFFLLVNLELMAGILFAAAVVLVNIWRPILLNRIDEVSDAEAGATVLSIDSQAGSFYMMIFAPLLGLAADRFGLWTVAGFGALTASVFVAAGFFKPSVTD